MNTADFKAIAAELIAEGHAPELYNLLPLVARRELLPDAAKAGDGLYAALCRNFPQTSYQELQRAVRVEITILGKAIFQKMTPPSPANEVAVWLRNELAGAGPEESRGKLMLVELALMSKTNSHQVRALSELYASLRKLSEPGGIIIIARNAARMANRRFQPEGISFRGI